GGARGGGVMEQLCESLGGPGPHAVASDEALRLAEAVRTLALKHGPAAVRHCTRAVESLRDLLDELGGAEEARASAIAPRLGRPTCSTRSLAWWRPSVCWAIRGRPARACAFASSTAGSSGRSLRSDSATAAR